jgi:hypothetical protein
MTGSPFSVSKELLHVCLSIEGFRIGFDVFLIFISSPSLVNPEEVKDYCHYKALAILYTASWYFYFLIFRKEYSSALKSFKKEVEFQK